MNPEKTLNLFIIGDWISRSIDTGHQVSFICFFQWMDTGLRKAIISTVHLLTLC